MTSPWPYPAPIDDSGAAHLVAGVPLPAISLVSTMGGRIDLSARAGRAILFVYPWTGGPGLANPPNWDDIPGAHGSTPEAEGFREAYPQFRASGLEVYGLSGQDPAHQLELATRLNLPFALLSDRGLAFAGALELPTFATGGVTYLKRLTIVLADGMIERVIYPVHPPHTHAAALVELVARSAGAEKL